MVNRLSTDKRNKIWASNLPTPFRSCAGPGIFGAPLPARGVLRIGYLWKNVEIIMNIIAIAPATIIRIIEINSMGASRVGSFSL